MLLGELTSLTTCPRCGFSIAIYPNQEYTKCKNCEKKISLKIYEFKGEKEMIDKYFELNQQINKFEEELDKCVTIEQKLEVQNKLLEKRKDLLYKHIEYGAEIEGEIEMINNNIIKVKRLREEAQLPTYGSELASGFDVRAYDCVVWDINKKELVPVKIAESNGEKGWFIDDNTTVIFKTGLAMACGNHEEVQARARSGYSLKTPMRISNGIGTIDEDFRGEVGIIMDNNGQYGRWFVPYAERVAQLVVCPVVRPLILEVDDLEDTQRGEDGYGSTGTK